MRSDAIPPSRISTAFAAPMLLGVLCFSAAGAAPKEPEATGDVGNADVSIGGSSADLALDLAAITSLPLPGDLDLEPQPLMQPPETPNVEGCADSALPGSMLE